MESHRSSQAGRKQKDADSPAALITPFPSTSNGPGGVGEPKDGSTALGPDLSFASRMSSNKKELSLIGVEGNDITKDGTLVGNMENPVRIPKSPVLKLIIVRQTTSMSGSHIEAEGDHKTPFQDEVHPETLGGGEDSTGSEAVSNGKSQAEVNPSTLGESNDNTGKETEERVTMSQYGKRTAVPVLPPVPASLSSPNDCLCDVCKALELSPRRFVVFPSDGES